MSWMSDTWNKIKYTFVKEPKYNGCKQDPKDDRDHIKNTDDLVLAKSSAMADFSLREFCPDVVDQGQCSSCTGFSSAYAMYILVSRMEKLSGFHNITVPRFSANWNYYHARLIDNENSRNPSQTFYRIDGGATLRSTMKALKQYGVIPHGGYITSVTNPLPNKLIGAEKSSFKIKEYLSIPNGFSIEALDTVQKVLAVEQLPILGCIYFYREQLNEANKTGMLRMIEGNKTLYGAHAICITGYKWMEGKPWIEFINSYGKSWGKSGYGYFEAEMLDDTQYIQSLWTFDKGYF